MSRTIGSGSGWHTANPPWLTDPKSKLVGLIDRVVGAAGAGGASATHFFFLPFFFLTVTL